MPWSYVTGRVAAPVWLCTAKLDVHGDWGAGLPLVLLLTNPSSVCYALGNEAIYRVML